MRNAPESEPRLGPAPDRVEELLAACLEYSGTEQDKRLRILCEQYPELAAELRRRFQFLRAAGFGPAIPAEREPPFPERLGDFRLIERLGAGGMGVVYRAEQLALGRLVALKLVRPEHLFFPGARERFRREVETVARLQHPGIVPVYTVGEESGVPYFAMELLPGATLAELLRAVAERAPERLTGADLAPAFTGGWVEACLSVARQVADALEHAHGRGVLHRDVKPSNVMVTSGGRAVLLDFGLTSLLAGDRITHSGDAVGTLPYMSPEQVQGRRNLDARSDVYSLGVTLYELLTLQLPYQGETRRELEQRILEGRADPLRARNRRVAVEAEIVCLHAMDVEPAQRYPGAADFAADLGNVLELRPIRARPLSRARRLRRWTQRHRGASAALAAGLLLVLGLPSGLLLQQRGHNRALQGSLISEKAARAAASRERDLALARSDQYEAITEFLVRLFAETDPERTESTELTSRELLDRGTTRLAIDLHDQPLTRAALLITLGQVRYNLGQSTAAVELLETALDLVRGREPVDAELLLRGTSRLAEAYASLGRTVPAEALFAEAESLILRRHGRGSMEWLEALHSRGRFLHTSLRFEEAEAVYREILAAMTQVENLAPLWEARFTGGFGEFLINRAQVLPEERQAAAFAEALVHLIHAKEIQENHPKTSRRQLGTTLNAVGLCLRHLGRFEEAAVAYGRAVAMFRAIEGERGPSVSSLLANQSGLLIGMGRHQEALPLIEEAVAIQRELYPAGHPPLVLNLGNLAGTLFRCGRYAEAEALYGEVLPLQRRVFTNLHPVVMASLFRLADMHLDQGRLDEARAELAELERILAGQEGFAQERRFLAERRERLAALDPDS